MYSMLGNLLNISGKVVPLRRIELPTPSLPMTCSTNELQRHAQLVLCQSGLHCGG
jgi:hypothetical protein